MAQQVIKSDCIMCINSCGINAYVEDGKLVKVEGMPEHGVSEGYICPRGEALVEYVYSPDRLQHPMQKVDGQWQRISWDQALDTIADELKKIKEKYGAKALAVYSGSLGTENIELAGFAQRFRGVYGTPNLLSVEGNCFRSRIMARQMTFGGYPIEEPWNSRCVIIWGQNMDNSRATIAAKIYKAMQKGTLEDLIVIDPKRIPMAKMGTHIRIRPGTDTALMLAMMNVIIGEKLYDKEFIEKNTIGFDKLAEHVKQYPPEDVEKITWVPADDIRKISRIFAGRKPAANVPGTCSIDQHINGFQGNRAMAILQTITGNVDIPGSWVSIPFLRLGDLRVTEISEPIGAEAYPLFRRFWGRTSPYGQQVLFADAVLDEKPYPLKALIVNGGNPALTLPDSERIMEAMRKLDFMVVMDPFMTETAKLADIVLPACTFLEKGGVGYVYGVNTGIPYAMLRKKLVEPVGESRADWQIWTDLARRMGYDEYFPWNTEEEVVDFFLKPSGLTRQQLEKENPEGKFYVEDDKKYLSGIYRTPSRKIEIYSETLLENGYDPLPFFVEPTQSPVSAPELAKKYPIILTTGSRIPQYTHTQLRNIPRLRKEAPEPLAEVNPETATRYGIADGDMMVIENPKGSIIMKAHFEEELSAGVVSIPHGWPEANANLLTSLDTRDPVTGYTEMKALLCRIRKS
ncbi:MAG: molybdopterin-dependent oxidoreductase [Desulfobacterales bacterium]|nr:molybdopterin-dependent oxidoreductase [Desulfobacterales bacterium]